MLAFVLASLPTAGFGLTLDETVRLALRTNPDVMIARDDVRIAEQDREQARAGYFPSLDFRASTGLQETNTQFSRQRSDTPTTLWRQEGNLSLRQMLYDFGGTSGDVDRARAKEAAAGERAKVSANTIALAAIEAYLEVLRNRELVRVATDSVRSHTDIVGRARARAGLTDDRASAREQDRELAVRGRGDTTELPRAEARMAGARANLEQARGRLRDAEATFLRVVGARPGELAPVPILRAHLPTSDEQAQGIALAQSPSLKAAAKDVEAATAEIDQADARFLPRFDVELSSGRGKNLFGTQGMSTDNTALLVMKYNLYQGGGDLARRRAALERLAKARNTLLQSRRTLEQETQISWNALETARDRLPILSEQLRQSGLAREAYQQQYEVGRKTVIDLLDAESDFSGASSNVVTGELTARFGEYRLLAAMAALFPALGLTDPDVAGSQGGPASR
jgi:outer membrane protein, adhesin transport system